MPFRPVILNHYLVAIERDGEVDGEVMARETVAVPREATARLEAGHRHRALLSSDDSAEMQVVQLPVTSQVSGFRHLEARGA